MSRDTSRRLAESVQCEVCGETTNSAERVCARTPACKREYDRRRRARPEVRELIRQQTRDYRIAHLPEVLAMAAAWRARTDRPCRYAAHGCTRTAAPGYIACMPHANRDRRLSRERRTDGTLATLAAGQDWLCGWCGRQLAADLTDVVIDHVIPVSRGGPEDQAWNWSAHHGACNIAKGSTITPDAERLAAERGVIIQPQRTRSAA